MTRRLLNLLTLLSLLLCVSLTALWATGGPGFEAYEKYGPRFGWGVYTGGGRLYVTWYFGDDDHQMVPQSYAHRSLPPGFASSFDAPRPGAAFDLRWGRFRLTRDAQGLKGWTVAAPLWALAAATALLPLWQSARRRTRRQQRLRSAAGLCPACGYDLTGNESGVCPECGSPAGKPAR